MVKSKTSTWTVCTGCRKKYLVPILMLGRWARCKECGIKFRLSEPGKKSKEQDIVHNNKKRNKTEVSHNVDVKDHDAVKAKRVTSHNGKNDTNGKNPSDPVLHHPLRSNNTKKKHPIQSPRKSRRSTIKVKEPSSSLSPKPSKRKPDSNITSSPQSVAQLELPVCPVCIEASLAGLSACPACGEVPDGNALAFRPVRSIRFEAELKAAVKIAFVLALLLGLFSFVRACLVFLHSGSLPEVLLHGFVCVVAAGVMSAGVRMLTFQRSSRFFVSAGLTLLAVVSTGVHILFSEPPVRFGAASLSVSLLCLTAFCLLPITARIFSPIYQLTVQPAMRHDHPLPWLPFVFLGYITAAACLYFFIV